MNNKGIKICVSIWGVIIILFFFIRSVVNISDGENIVQSIKANARKVNQKNSIKQDDQEEKETEDLYEQIVVAIDPGHGGNDCGAIACDEKTYEKDINLFIALELKRLLEENHITVIMTRESDEYVALEERVNTMNVAKPELSLSIHCNSFEEESASGLTIYYDEQRLNDTFGSEQFSTTIADEIAKVVPYKNRGIVEGNHLYIVRNTESIVALAEIGFISYERDFNFIKEQTNQKIIAKSLYDGIIKSLPYTEGNKDQ